MQLPEGVVADVDGDLTVVRVAPPTVAEVEVAAPEAAAQPEVIKEKKPEEKEAAK